MSNSRDEAIYTVGDLAGKIGVRPSHVRRMIDDGRIPFLVKIGGSWMLEERSIQFVLEWHPRLGRGRTGHIAAAAMRTAAGKVDPACKRRRQAWKKAYPQGWGKPK